MLCLWCEFQSHLTVRSIYSSGDDGRYRMGPPVYLDVWNVSAPTVMVMEVRVSVDGSSPTLQELRMAPLTPQLLVESGRVASINVAYQLLSRVAFSVGCDGGFVNFPDLTKATVHFKVDYFPSKGRRWSHGLQLSISCTRLTGSCYPVGSIVLSCTCRRQTEAWPDIYQAGNVTGRALLIGRAPQYRHLVSEINFDARGASILCARGNVATRGQAR